MVGTFGAKGSGDLANTVTQKVEYVRNAGDQLAPGVLLIKKNSVLPIVGVKSVDCVKESLSHGLMSKLFKRWLNMLLNRIY